MTTRQSPIRCIWFISKYASPPGSDAGLRGISLTTEFAKLGIEAVVINSRANHYVHEERPKREPIFRGFELSHHLGVAIYTHKTLLYHRTASFRRLLSWVHFELGLLRMPVRKLPLPTHIIVSSLSLLTILNGVRISRLLGAKLVFEIRDLWPLSLTERYRISPRNPFVRILQEIERFGLDKSDAVVGTMPNLREHVESITNQTSKVFHVGMGLDALLLKQEHLEIRENPSEFSVAYAGSFGRANSIGTLLNCAYSLKDQKDISFDFFGDGDLLEEYIERYSGESQIRFHGHVPRQNLIQQLRFAHLLIVAFDDSKLWRFGQSNQKLVDYMAVGKPIVAAYNGFPSMINEANCGQFIPAGDSEAMKNSILSYRNMTPDQRKAIGSRGKSWIFAERKYGTLALKYIQVLRSIDDSRNSSKSSSG